MAIDRPIELLVFAHALQGRGTERSIVRILQEIDRGIVRPKLVLASARGRFLEDVPSDIPIYDLGIGNGRTSFAALRLNRLIKKLSPDCTMGIHISAGRVLGALRLLHRGLPVICMEADPFTRIEGSKGRLALRLFASRLTYRSASRVIAASDVVAEDLIEHLHVPPEKISLIPLASVDESIASLAKEPLRESPFGEGDREPIVIAVGNMFEHKDQVTLLRAFALVQHSLPCHLVLIGEGTMRSHLEQLTSQLEIQERVQFKGFQKNPFKFLARSQVFVSSSVAEGFDISQIEAMACGVPVIVTDAPRFRAITHGTSGLIVPPQDPHALADAIVQILTSPRLAQRLARNAQVAANDFSARRIARRYEQEVVKLVRRRE